MNQQGLNAVMQNPKVPQGVKKVAQAMQRDPKVQTQMHQLAHTNTQLTQAQSQQPLSQEQRTQVVAQAQSGTPPPVTQAQNDQAVTDIDDLFDDI